MSACLLLTALCRYHAVHAHTMYARVDTLSARLSVECGQCLAENGRWYTAELPSNYGYSHLTFLLICNVTIVGSLLASEFGRVDAGLHFRCTTAAATNSQCAFQTSVDVTILLMVCVPTQGTPRPIHHARQFARLSTTMQLPVLTMYQVMYHITARIWTSAFS
jgi:hypothetical protein